MKDNTTVSKKAILANSLWNVTARAKFWVRAYLFGDNIRLYFNRTSELAIVPIDLCTNFLGFSFGQNGWHYYTALLKEYEASPSLSFEESVLYAYHQRYQPTTFSDYLEVLKNPQFSPPIGIYPWGHFNIALSRRGGRKKRLIRTLGCGPSPDSLIERDFIHSLRLYEKVKRAGYQPWLYENGFVKGVFLIKNNGEQRVLINEGNHRCAILSVLGYKNVQIRLTTGFFHYLREEDVDEWHYVKTGDCSRDDALAYFNVYFECNGMERARALGLLAPKQSKEMAIDASASPD